MIHVDAAVLNIIERLCRRFQLWTGRTNIWVAFQLTNLSVALYFVWAVALYWRSGLLLVRVFIACFCAGVFVILTRTIFRTSVEFAEEEAYRRVAKGLRNPRRVRDAQLRVAFLTLSLVLTYPLWFAYRTLQVQLPLLTAALILLTTVLLYTLACDPLPPSTGKVREWLTRARLASPVRQTAQGIKPG